MKAIFMSLYPDLLRKKIRPWVDCFTNALISAPGIIKKIIYLFPLIILSSSCKKENDDHAIPPVITQFNKVYGGSEGDYAVSVTRSTDGGYVFAGVTNSNDGDVSSNHGGNIVHDAWVVKLNKEGKIIWEKALGGSEDEQAYCIIPAPGGGYVIAGATQSNDGDVSGNHGSDDFWVVRLNENGDIVWQKSMGGSGGDYATSIISTSDGRYIIVGATQSNDGDVTGFHGNADAWVVKLDKDGNLLWQIALGGTNTEYFQAITETQEGSYVMAGLTLSNDGDVTGLHGRDDAWVVKLTKDGQLVWQKTLGGSGEEIINSIVITSDNGFVSGGFTNSNDGDVSGHQGGGDAWVVKLDTDGNILWQKALGGSMGENANSVITTSDGGYIMAGSTNSNDGDVTGDLEGRLVTNAWIVKLDKDGNKQWQKLLGGSDIDIAFSVITSVYGGYVMPGLTVSNNADVSGNHGSTDAWVVTFEDP